MATTKRGELLVFVEVWAITVPSDLHKLLRRRDFLPYGAPKCDSGCLWAVRWHVVLVDESVEDLLPADPDLGEIEWFRRAGLRLSC